MKYIALLFTLLAFSSCENGPDPDGDIERKFYLNAELSALEPSRGEFVNWNSGDKTIFRFVLTHPEEPNIADDELSEIFWIEIEPRFTEFHYSLSRELLRDPLGMEFYYTRSCFCYFPQFEFSDLEVSGKKLSASEWEVSFNMTAEADEQSYSLSDKGIYTLDTFDWD